jgi:hypothetical protein
MVSMPHAPHCACCNDFIDSRSLVTQVYVSDANVGMGSLGFDIFGGLFDFAKAIADAVIGMIRAVVDGIKNMVMGIYNALRKIDWDKIGKDLGKAVGNFLVAVNPFALTNKFLREFPLTSNIYRELDKFTGGALTTMENLSTLAGRVIRGDAISREEMVQNLLFGIRVAAIFFAGPAGSAAVNAATVGAVAGQLKQGTLGKTALGRDLLGIAEVAGYAYAAGSSISDALMKKATDDGQAYVLSNTDLGKGDLGPFLAGLAFNSANAAYAGASQWDSLTSYSKSYSKNLAVKETAQSIGGPYANQIATSLVDAGQTAKFDPSKINFSVIPQGYSFNQFLEDAKKAYGDVSNSITNFMNSSGGQTSFPQFDFSKAGDLVKKTASDVVNEIQRIPSNVADAIENLSYPKISSPDFPGLSVPDIKSPSFDMNANLDWEKIYKFIDKYGMYALLMKKGVMRNGKRYTVYVMQDGSIYYIEEENYLLYALLGAAAVAAVSTNL